MESFGTVFICLFSILRNSQLESDVCPFAVNVNFNLSNVYCSLIRSHFPNFRSCLLGQSSVTVLTRLIPYSGSTKISRG